VPIEQQITTIIDSDIERNKWKKRLDQYSLEKEQTLTMTLTAIFGSTSSSVPL
jgi:hypothetical protein